MVLWECWQGCAMDSHNRSIEGSEASGLDGVTFNVFVGGRILPVTISIGALIALGEVESTSPIDALRACQFLILATAVRMPERNPCLDAVHLNSDHFIEAHR